MARTHAALTNGGWQAPQSAAADQDPRSQRTAPPGQRPAQPGPQQQPAPAAGYPPQGGYPAQGGGYPGQGTGYDPQQAAYHYPQHQQPAGAPPPGVRPGLSPLDAGAPSPSYGQAPQPRGFVAPGAAPGFRPAAPFAGQARQPDPMAAAGYDQWSVPMPGPDPRGYDLGNYMPTGVGRPDGSLGDPLQHQADWPLPGQGAYGEAAHDPTFQGGQMGYEQPHSGALEQAYAHEEGAEYEVEEPRRGSWALRIAGAIVVAIGLGYGLAQGYKFIAGGAPDGATPVVRGDDAPTKTKPTEPGGKQFAHTDSKVMGRLGEAAPVSAQADASAVASPSTSSTAGPDTDASGARKVTTLVVGRDGSIVPPEAPTAPAAPPQAEPGSTASTVAVPGVTMVDGFGGQYPGATTTTASTSPSEGTQSSPATAHRPVVVKPPEQQAAVVTSSTTPAMDSEPTSAAPSEATTGALPPKHQPTAKRMAAATPPAAASAPSASSGNGYVVVLASVPASGGSRLVALKKFADMQQQYGSVLQNKTPDVREANLGAKGVYNRLLVGPPGSRAQASALCSELKAAGYKDCWVTAY
jgi:SPOR domain